MKGIRSRLLIVALLLFAGPALQPLPCGAAAETPARLSERERMRIFDQVWKYVQRWYYDPSLGGVDWKAVGEDFRPRAIAASSDEELHALIAEMLTRFKDTHTYYEPPAKYSVLARFGALGRGFEVAEIEGRFTVTSVDPALAALQSKIRPGLVLRTIDGQPVETRARDLEPLIRRAIGFSTEKVLPFAMRQAILRTPAEQPMTLSFVDPMGNPVEARIDKALASKPEPPMTSRRLASGLGYIRWTSWDRALANEIQAYLASLGDAPGLIIDLRGNGGGDANLIADVLSCLSKEAVPLGLFYGRAPLPKYKAYPCPRVYTGPVAVLINGESGSSSEIFSNLIQERRRGLVVGQPSLGSVLDSRVEQIRGGGRVRMSLWGYKSPKGKVLQGNSIVPDVAAEPTIQGVWEGRDEILEAAERALDPKKEPPQ